jgi:hypothetical protein
MKPLLAVLAIAVMSATAVAQATADDLKKHIGTLQAALTAGKTEEAAKITEALIPSQERLKKALSDRVPADVITKFEGLYKAIPREPAQLSKVLAGKPGQTEIQVHAATTEEIAKYAPGSVAANEFPEATKVLAEKGVLRPGVTFYEVEFLEPGKELGTKYHLFYHDGAAWTILGPIWRIK